MSPQLFPPVPADTANAAKAVLGKNNFYLATGDQADGLLSGLALNGPSASVQISPQKMALLYLITIFQFIESLPDYVASDALRQRVDWKYALHLPLNHPGLEASSLCEFRMGLLADQAGDQNLQNLFSRMADIIRVTGKAPRHSQSTCIVKSVCLLSRVGTVWFSTRQALESLAVSRPDWLRTISLPPWYARYRHRWKANIWTAEPPDKEVFAQAIGADAYYLLRAISESGMPELASLPEVLALERVFGEQFVYREGKVAWRKEGCLDCLSGSLNKPSMESLQSLAQKEVSMK